MDQPLNCELQGGDLYGKKYKMVRVKGLTTSWAMKNNVTSGVTTILPPEGAEIDDQTNELVVPSGTVIKVRTSSCNNRFVLGMPFVKFRDVVETLISHTYQNPSSVVAKRNGQYRAKHA